MSNAKSSAGSASDDNVAKTKSTAAATSDGVENGEQVSDQAKGAVERRRINLQMAQNVLLIWLDRNIDENNAACRNTMMQLRRVVNNINTYTNGEKCIQFLETTDNDKVCMIISGYLGQRIVPCVHDMPQVDSIFIFCGNKKRYKEWTKDWSKIKGVFTEIAPICESLKQAAQQYEHNAISMSFVSTSEDLSKKKLDQLDPSFMYTQILKEILLSINFEPKHFTEFVEYCRNVFKDNADELQNVNKLQTEYRDQTPIWWYTLDCFLYRMLNRALRLMNVDIIIKMGFFIDDLHRHIDQLHHEQYGTQNSMESFVVSRGQGISRTEFDRMIKTKGGLISFNNFLSTSTRQTTSLEFANDALENPDLVGVVFVMTIDPSQSTTPFASITDVSFYKDAEDEVLFAMHTVFRINNIQPMGGSQRLYQVDLTLTNDNDKDLRQLTDRIRKETEGATGWVQLGVLLLKIGQPGKAEQVYNILLGQVTEEIEIARVHHRIGLAKYDLGEYKDALTFYEKALEIRQRLLPPNHPDLAKSYNNIGNVYSGLGEYSKELSYYEKALTIWRESLPPNHPDLAKAYNNIGLVYSNMGEYSEALSSHEKAIAIRQQSLPPNHPDLAVSHNNIGEVYRNMHDYSKALSSHEKALEIKQQSLPPNHPDLAKSYGSIGNVYFDMDDYPKALLSHEQALAIRQQSLPPIHSDLAKSYNNIGNVHRNMGEYSKAYQCYQRAVEIGEQSLPSDHPELQKWQWNLGRIKYNL